jgi:hypothetical protein
VYNLDKEKTIILILTLPLFVSALLLLALRSGFFIGEAARGEYESETIYARCECADCHCRDEGKKLLSFKGPDAECEDYESEDERMTCYYNNSQASFACPYLEDKKAVEDCFEKYKGSVFNYYQGGAGTLVTNQSYTTGGSRMYLAGSDCNGECIVKTGTDEPTNNVMTFRDSSRDVQYGGDVDMIGIINIQSAEGGAYFGSDVRYGEKDLGGGKKGQGLVYYDNFNGMNLNGCLDMKVLANHNHLMTIPGNEREHFGSVEIEKGLEVNGDLKTDFMYFQGRFLRWSQPIRGHWILYYKTPPKEPNACEEPDLPRDQAPNPIPHMAGMGEVGPSESYYNADGGGAGGGGGGGGGASGGGGAAGPAPDGTPSSMDGYNTQITVNWSGAYVSVDKILQRKFVFPGRGPSYGSEFLFVFNDGQRIHVTNPSHYMIVSSAGRKYQPGGTGDISSMEVYADRGSSPSSVTVYYNK